MNGLKASFVQLFPSDRTGLRWDYDFNDDDVVDFADVLSVLGYGGRVNTAVDHEKLDSLN